MKKNKGITLIALVITIIVLLILAGVTINAIVGNESAMEKAKEAKLEDEKGNELDTIKLAVVDGISIGDTGLLTLDNLKTALRKIPAVVEETEVNKISGKAPWTVKAISGREYDITQYGQVTDSTPRPAGLYNDDGYTSWDKLIEDGVICRLSGSFTASNKDALNGDLIIPDNVTRIIYRAFQNCRNLTSVKLPKGLISIEEGAFQYCSNLTTIKIPDSVTSIGKGAFEQCNSLVSITIPEGVTSISNSLFLNCNNLKDVTLPNSITSIEEWAFAVTSLTSITIPEGVTSIGGCAFWGCSDLTNITIPDSLTSMGTQVFINCSSLTSIEIPEGITTIGLHTFNGCSSLNSITLPVSLTNIGQQAFDNCNSLTTVNYAGTQEQWMEISGRNQLANATINYNYSPES